jgi:hypothetical protein
MRALDVAPPSINLCYLTIDEQRLSERIINLYLTS